MRLTGPAAPPSRAAGPVFTRAVVKFAGLPAVSLLEPSMEDRHENNRSRNQHPILQMRVDAERCEFSHEPVTPIGHVVPKKRY